MMIRIRSFLLLSIILTAVPGTGYSLVPPDRHTPRLVVVLVVDQMRADYLDRFGRYFHRNGFRLLMDHGAWMTNCNYLQVPTTTGPGHSIVLSGIPPSSSGVIGNEWYQHSLGRQMYCVEDSSVKAVGTAPDDPAGKMSPVNFRGETFGDLLRRHSPAARVIGIAIKDRAAILPAGHAGASAYWFDARSGRWITSSYYRTTLPGWAERFNASGLVDRCLGQSWNLLLPDSAYASASPDDAPGEGLIPGEDRPVFPHVVTDLAGSGRRHGVPADAKRFEALLATPFGNDITFAFADSAITGEHLGSGPSADILAVSLSAPDHCGHLFGPDSREIEDMYLRLDVQLEEFFAFLDRAVGLDNTVIVLTADHGVAPLPETNPERGGARINGKEMLVDIKVAVGQKYDYNEGLDNCIEAFNNESFYIDTQKVRAHGIDPGMFEDEVGRAALRDNHLAKYITERQLRKELELHHFSDPYYQKISLSFSPGRSGQVYVIPRPYSFFSSGTTGTSHGTGYEYDTHVPLLLMGHGIRAGHYDGACSPYDVVPTVSALLSIPAPDKSIGTILPVLSSAGKHP